MCIRDSAISEVISRILAIGKFFSNPKGIFLTLALSLILLIALRIGIEQLDELTLNLPKDCYSPENMKCQDNIQNFYHLHDWLLRSTQLELFSQLRPVILLSVGVAWPLLHYLIRIDDLVVRKVMRPYFSLISVHGIALLFAQLAVGVGMLPFVGCFFSLARTAQLLYLNVDTIGTRPLDKGSRKQEHGFFPLRLGLSLLAVIWAANAIYLLIFIVQVTYGLSAMGLEPRLPT